MVGWLSNKLMNIQGLGWGSRQWGHNRSTPSGPVQIFEYPPSDKRSPVRGTRPRRQGERYSPCWPDLEVVTTISLGISAINNIAHWPHGTNTTLESPNLRSLTLTFKVICPFPLKKQHLTLLLYTDLGRPRVITHPKCALVFIWVAYIRLTFILCHLLVNFVRFCSGPFCCTLWNLQSSTRSSGQSQTQGHLIEDIKISWFWYWASCWLENETVNTPWNLNLSGPIFNSLGPSDAIWQQRSGSPLAQVMACCLMAPSHYLHQCWLHHQ